MTLDLVNSNKPDAPVVMHFHENKKHILYFFYIYILFFGRWQLEPEKWF